MEWDKTDSVHTPTQVVLGPPDVTDRLQHTSSQPAFNSNNNRNTSVYLPSRIRKKPSHKVLNNSQPFSVVSAQRNSASLSENVCVPTDLFNTAQSFYLFDEDVDDKIDEEDLGEEESEENIYRSSLPVASYIGIRPPAALLPGTTPPVRHTPSSSSLLSSSSTLPSSSLSSSIPPGRRSTTAQDFDSPESSTPTPTDSNYNKMGVICPSDLSNLERDDSLGFQEPASPASFQFLSQENSFPLEKVPADEQVTSFPFPQLPTTRSPSPKKQTFTFETKYDSNIELSPQSQDRLKVHGTKTPSSGLSVISEPRNSRLSPRSPRSPRSPGSRPSFRRQLSKRKSETLLDVPPTLPEYDSDEFDDEEEEFHSIGRISGPCTPISPKARRLNDFDPYQVFEVQRKPCRILTVRVLRGRNITMGLQDLYDTPDPYINLYLRTSPDGRKSTTVKANNTNPVWDEEFTFYINSSQINVLQITLMESNLLFDQEVGMVNFDLSRIKKMDVLQKETFIFNEISEVDVEFLLQLDSNPTLRYSLCLSDAEKQFQELRKEKVFHSMRRLLGQEDGPMTINEVPNIAVIGSGGGFRALTGYSGVFKALVESGILDCTMYACGLSGSSWFLSTLYSHPKWPNLDMGEFLDELMNSIDKKLVRFFNPSTIYQYAQTMVKKRTEGQPVSFTDIFGRMVGETLLPGRMDTTLTDQRQKLKDGHVPMPLYTCVHVKKDVPARSFQEWVEFSPYEIGLPKYGTFMDSELFGSKFFMGKLVKQYKEQPLHFLQGIWGSAFCILFKRLLEDNRRIDPAEMIRQEIKHEEGQDDLIRKEMDEELNHGQSESSSDCSDDDELDGEEINSFESHTDDVEGKPNSSMESNRSPIFDHQQDGATVSMDGNKAQEEDSAYEGEEEEDEDDNSSFAFLKDRRSSVEMKKNKNNANATPARKGIICASADNQRLNASDGLKKSVNWGTLPVQEGRQKARHEAFARANSNMRKSRTGSMSYWKRMMKGFVESKSWEVLSTRRGRAAVIHNFMRGLSLQQTFPLSPFTPVHERVKEGDEFDSIFEMVPTSLKHIYMVDAGLTFNSPYPLILRPQREVDIILSFDFSARPSDKHQPFKELLLAEKWAHLNRLPFPPIDVSKYDKDDVKELYIFKHPMDPHCPVVFHFALVNNKFKFYSKPDIPRQTKEEFDFAEFDIFDDPKAPYSTFSFTYAHESFKRLSKLTEFNTLLHIDKIKEEMKAAVKRKRQNQNRYYFTNEIKLLRLKSVQAMRKKLHRFISRMGSTHPSSSTTPLLPITPGTPSTNPFFSGYSREISASSTGDDGAFGTPSEYDVPDFCLVSNQQEVNLSHLTPTQNKTSFGFEKEKRAVLLSTESVYGTPPESNEGIDNLEQTSTSLLPAATDTISLSNSMQSQKSSSFSSISGGETSTPKVIIASKMRTRKESPPNPFFTSFIKSTMSSASSSPSSSSPIYPDLTGNKSKGTRKSRRISKKHRPSVLQPLTSPSCSSPATIANALLTLSIPNASQVASPSVSTLNTSGSSVSSGYSSLSNRASGETLEAFSLAPEAFKSDGTPVMDSTEAKMYHDSVKAKRKLLRRQSTVSSLNNISLDETNNDEVGNSFVNGTSPCAGNNTVEMNDDNEAVTPMISDNKLEIIALSHFEGTAPNEINQNLGVSPDGDVINSSKLCCEPQNQGQNSIDSCTDVTFTSFSL